MLKCHGFWPPHIRDRVKIMCVCVVWMGWGWKYLEWMRGRQAGRLPSPGHTGVLSLSHIHCRNTSFLLCSLAVELGSGLDPETRERNKEYITRLRMPWSRKIVKLPKKIPSCVAAGSILAALSPKRHSCLGLFHLGDKVSGWDRPKSQKA